MNGKKADSNVYLDFDEVECEDYENSIDGEDWDGEDFDDDAEDWQKPREESIEGKETPQKERLLSLWQPEGLRQREADIWRTRLGGEQ